MRTSKLGVLSARPTDRTLAWLKLTKPRLFTMVICSPSDFAGWMADIPPDIFVIGRYIGAGDIDNMAWTEDNAHMLAEKLAAVHATNFGRIDAFECVCGPVVHTVEDMERLASFERVWAEDMRDRGLYTIVGNFNKGCPEPDLMPYFRPALEVADFFGHHGYGCPKVLTDSYYYALRYQMLLQAAHIDTPVILTEVGVDCEEGDQGGYKSRWSDIQYIEQLTDLDAALRADDRVFGAAVFGMGMWGWPTFDLGDEAAFRLGQYIVGQGDVSNTGQVLTAYYRFEPSQDWIQIGNMQPAFDNVYSLVWHIPQEGRATLQYVEFTDGVETGRAETGALTVDWEAEQHIIEPLFPVGGEIVRAHTLELRVRVHHSGQLSLSNVFRAIRRRFR